MARKYGSPANEIVPGLWLGNREAALSGEWLAQHRIATVFNCTKDIPFHESIRRQYRVPVDDNLQEAEIRNLGLWSSEIVYKIAVEHRQAAKEGKEVLVHCAAGMQRSAASVAMYLIASQAMTTEEAMAFIQSKRPIAFQPAANFEAAIRDFEGAFNRDVRPHLASQAPR